MPPSICRPAPRAITETAAFPAHIAADVAAVVASVSPGEHSSPSHGFVVQVRDEQLQIPYRVYYDENRLLECSSRAQEQGWIALCFATRHHNGFVREQCVRKLLVVEEDWVVPFVTQLVGEYVIEIVQAIETEIAKLNPQIYSDYFNANAALLGTIARRVVSYWNVYYRTRYPRLADYPAQRVLEVLRKNAQNDRLTQRHAPIDCSPNQA